VHARKGLAGVRVSGCAHARLERPTKRATRAKGAAARTARTGGGQCLSEPGGTPLVGADEAEDGRAARAAPWAHPDARHAQTVAEWLEHRRELLRLEKPRAVCDAFGNVCRGPRRHVQQLYPLNRLRAHGRCEVRDAAWRVRVISAAVAMRILAPSRTASRLPVRTRRNPALALGAGLRHRRVSARLANRAAKQSAKGAMARRDTRHSRTRRIGESGCVTISPVRGCFCPNCVAGTRARAQASRRLTHVRQGARRQAEQHVSASVRARRTARPCRARARPLVQAYTRARLARAGAEVGD